MEDQIQVHDATQLAQEILVLNDVLNAKGETKFTVLQRENLPSTPVLSQVAHQHSTLNTAHLFVQLLLPRLAVVLRALLLGHVFGLGRTGVRVEGRELGVGLLLDGLDAELLLGLQGMGC